MQTQTVTLAIKQIYPNLSRKEQLIADYLLENRKAFIHGTITDISRELGVAESTVFRFCKQIGFKGFHDLKIALASEGAPSAIQIHENVTPEDSFMDIARKVFSSSIKSLEDTMAIINQEDLEKATKMLLGVKSIGFFGLGGSSVIAMDAYHKFLRSNITCCYTMDKHFQLIEATKMKENDCAIIISHTGMNKDTLEICDAAKMQGAGIIAITSFSHSLLAKKADAALISSSDEISYRSEALSSRIAQLGLIDVLYVSTMLHHEKGYADSLENMRAVISKTKYEL